MADDLKLPPPLQDVLRRWKTAVAVALAVFAGSVVYARSLPNQYVGTVVVSFSPKPTASAGADTLRVVLPRYVAYVTSPATLNRVAGRIGEQARDLTHDVDASVEPDSANLTIRVTRQSPRRAADAANVLAAETLDFAANDRLLDAVLVAAALPDPTPSGPPRALLEAASLVVGALLGAAVAFLLERGRPRVRTWREVGMVTGYPLVGRVPPSRSLAASSAEALADPMVGAAVRTLRTNLERMSREEPVHVLEVTSSLPGEGKTTLASALAVTLARLDADVLLIDADLRRPGISKLFGLTPAPGTSTILRGEARLEECLRGGPVPRLTILPTAADKDAGDLLARRFSDLLRKARERFDVVVVDAPPLLGGDDARTLATLCDGVVLVVATDSPAHSVSEAAAALDALGVRVLGAVANRARDPRGMGSYGAYGTYGAESA